MRRGWLDGTLAVIVNAGIVWAVMTMAAVEPFRPFSYPSVVVLTVLGAIGATVVYTILVRRTDRPNRMFAVVVAVILLSFVPDLTSGAAQPGATQADIVVLMAMHATVAGSATPRSHGGLLGPVTPDANLLSIPRANSAGWW